MADGFVIETTDLRKRYDGVEALRGLTLAVPAGSICGFLGRTGAGNPLSQGIPDVIPETQLPSVNSSAVYVFALPDR